MGTGAVYEPDGPPLVRRRSMSGSGNSSEGAVSAVEIERGGIRHGHFSRRGVLEREVGLAIVVLKADLELELRTREPDEYLLHPKWSPKRPLDPSSLHLHFKKWLERPGLPATIKTHELRHSAADNLWRETGNLLLAQRLLRHESVATTQAYLHPSRDDLAQALNRLQVVKSEPDA